ncbi:Ak7 [Scenedesmus sp. PABB004]|nr:Ak7 [Scenedesmus sp. PABB004]
MRVAVYPGAGYVAAELLRHLASRGHDVVAAAPPDEPGAADAWAGAVEGADAVFHVLHGHEAHARRTVQRLLRRVRAHGPGEGPAPVFVGISTPLTWAATPAAAADAGASGARASGEDDAGAGGAAPQTGAGGGQQLTHRDAAARRPAAAALEAWHVEQLLLRCARSGRLAAYVVLPGVLYGSGEDDAQLHGLFRAAWEGGAAPLRVAGCGANRVPTCCVADLAAFCAAVAEQRPPSPYLLACDDEAPTQAALVRAVAAALGGRRVEAAGAGGPGALLAAPPHGALLLLDLPLAPSHGALPRPWEVERVCPRGLLGHLPQVLAELVAARRLAPLRLVLRGPPASGKSRLAARLAARYGLVHVDAAAILAELPRADGDTQKAAAAQLGREGRLSAPLMARLAQQCLARDPAAALQGWVLDGWLRSLAAARAFAAQPDERRAAGERGGRRASILLSDGGAACARRRTAAFEDGGEGAAPPLSAELLPHFVIELDAPDEELLRRVFALTAAEAAEAAAAAAEGASQGGGRPSRKPASAGRGKDAAGAAGAPPGSHNNERDWARRMEAHRALLAEDAADLAARRAAAAAVQAAQAGASPLNTPGRAARSGAPARLPAPSPAAAGREAGGAAAPPDARLPEHGGFLGFFADAGAQVIRLSSAREGGGCCGPQPAALPAAEAQLVAVIGAPHNYRGFPPDPQEQPEQQQSGQQQPQQAQAGGAAAVQRAAAGPPAASAELLAAAVALAAEGAARRAARVKAAARPLVASLVSGVMPALMAGLVRAATSRPADPLAVIAEQLLAAAAAARAGRVSPDDADPHDEQLRAEVEAAAAAAAASAEAGASREAAARGAAAAAEAEAAPAPGGAREPGWQGAPAAAAPVAAAPSPAGLARPGSAAPGGRGRRAPSPRRRCARAD